MRRVWLKKHFLSFVVVIIGFLLLANIYLIYQNSIVIEKNRSLQVEAEGIKVNTLDIVRNLHKVDMAIRGYALVREPVFRNTCESGVKEIDDIFNKIEYDLTKQQYPLDTFRVMKNDVKAYYAIVSSMVLYLTLNKTDNTTFLQFLKDDPGLQAWHAYKKFSDHVNIFEGHISSDARLKYQAAIRRSYWLQILLFLLAMPTLMYSAYYANRALKISERLRKSEEDNSRILANQNETLERLVHERTNEITAQNEEIAAQNEEMVSHNEQLVAQQIEIEKQKNELAFQNEDLKEAKKIIENQNTLIHHKNEELEVEVKKQTRDLKSTNLELIEQNNRLEQFAYIISHNLRAPMARIIGLAQVFDYVKNQEEIIDLVKMMSASTTELDTVIKDLAKILEIQKMNTQVLVPVNLRNILAKIIQNLKRELLETKAQLKFSLDDDTTLNTIPPYMESIFYNLISNAIKYRSPLRTLVLSISSQVKNGYMRIEIKDNGLGIDLEKHRDKLFLLYKRFHFHVEGKGMGLYLVKTQVTALGGKITIQSKLNEGTTFTLFFRK